MCTSCLNSHVHMQDTSTTDTPSMHIYVYTYVHAHTRDGAVKQSNFYYRSTVCVYMVCGRATRTYEISSSTSVLLVLSASDKARAPALLSPLKARFSLRSIWFDYKVVRERVPST